MNRSRAAGFIPPTSWPAIDTLRSTLPWKRYASSHKAPNTTISRPSAAVIISSVREGACTERACYEIRSAREHGFEALVPLSVG